MKNRLLNLIMQNRAGRAVEPIRAETSGDGKSASLYLYDVIDSYWGVSAKNFVDALNAVTAPVIHLRINSPGGDVFEARAMKAAIEQHPSRIVAHVDGLSASAASFLMMGADEVVASEGSFVMIHNAWSLAMGNADSLRHQANLLDKVDGQIVRDYTAKSGQTQRQIKEWMAAETWFTAKEAIDAKLVDAIDAAPPKAAAKFNLAAFDNPPAAYATATEEQTPPADPNADQNQNQDEPEDSTINAEGEAARLVALRRLEMLERTAP